MNTTSTEHISKAKALAIAQERTGCLEGSMSITDVQPDNYHLYLKIKGHFWFVTVVEKRSDGININLLSGSHVIVISKTTGEVIYDGDAGDEG